MKTQTALFLAILTAAAQADPLRMSANYSMPTDTTDLGGRKTASAAYSIDASIGGVTGSATAGPPAAPIETAKTGYIAQLYEVTRLALNAVSLTVNEGATDQLAAWQSLDDSTFLAVPATSVAWSVLSGPLSINASGLATAEIIYQNATASVQGTYAANISPPFVLPVLNVNKDDYREYAGDQMDDDWQVLYFGLPPNPIAGPLFDPDGDGQNNYFEWIAGLVPTDGNSVFKLRIVGSFQGANLIFGPTVAGRIYTVKYGSGFLDVPNWPTLASGTITDIGNQRTVTDTNAFSASPKKFYRVEISK